MNNFTYHNPVKIVFGKGSISELAKLVPPDKKVMVVYAGEPLKQNGVYDQVLKALSGRTVLDFDGVETNPQYDTCLKVVRTATEEDVGFLLAVGGGSVIDAVKFIAGAAKSSPDDPWAICTSRGEAITDALPFGCVLTLPATGSEMNCGSVISRASLNEKRTVISQYTFPQFSILDPEATYSLPQKQLRNGLVDSFAHAAEQYVTYDLHTPLQDRQAEAILNTLLEVAPRIKEGVHDYDARASFMWCATQALNGLIVSGSVGDFASHDIGHEMTAFFGLAHAESVAAVLPGTWRHQKANKLDKLAQFAERVWNVTDGTREQKADVAILRTVDFFHSLGMPTTLGRYGITADDIEKVVRYFREVNLRPLGERANIRYKEIEEILTLCL